MGRVKIWFGIHPCNSVQLLRPWHGPLVGTGIVAVPRAASPLEGGPQGQRGAWLTWREEVVLTLYFVVISLVSLVAGNVPREEGGKGFVVP